MIFLSTVMDEEETNTNNSVEHYDDHGSTCILSLVSRLVLWSQAYMLMSISRSQRLLAFYNDQCPGVLWVQLTPDSVRNVKRCVSGPGNGIDLSIL